MEAVHADWKEYLNLLICEENHLKNMDEYHKVCEYLNIMLFYGHLTKEGNMESVESELECTVSGTFSDQRN